MDPASYWLIGITLLLTAFFSGMEIAYLTANKLRIELDSKKGGLAARVMAFFVRKPTHFFTTTLVGINIAIVLYSICFSGLLQEFLISKGWVTAEQENLIFVLQTVIGSFVLLILGEFLPKALFRASPNVMLNVLAVPFQLSYYLLWPLIMLVVKLSHFILKYIFQAPATPQTQEFTRHDLFHYVEQSGPSSDENIADVDKEIFRNAIEFPQVKVRECMIPRTDMVTVEVTEDIEKVKSLFIESGHSKLLVYRETIDNIIGYVHLVDLYRSPKTLDKMVMPIIITTEAMSASELMKQLIDRRRSIAVVVDEFGGTAGMITIEDIIEQIIGEIEDEHDVDDRVEKQISDTEYIFSARLEIDYLNETYPMISLPEGDYDTLGGLIYFVNQNIPQEGDVISMAPFTFTIMSMEQHRIGEVHIKIEE